MIFKTFGKICAYVEESRSSGQPHTEKCCWWFTENNTIGDIKELRSLIKDMPHQGLTRQVVFTLMLINRMNESFLSSNKLSAHWLREATNTKFLKVCRTVGAFRVLNLFKIGLKLPKNHTFFSSTKKIGLSPKCVRWVESLFWRKS